jgi:hypothetical protein
MGTLPYVTSPGNIEKALNTIKTAAVPERISQDFVKTILKIPSGSGDQMTTFLKKIGFAGSDGKPTPLYTSFRNPSTSKKAVAQAIKLAYAPLYTRNEFMHELTDEQLTGLVIEETGASHDSTPVKCAVSCIKNMKKFADFTQLSETAPTVPEPQAQIQAQPQLNGSQADKERPRSFGLNLGYTINLNLPATTDQAVFNAIFKSLKENLFSDDDA